MAGVFNTIMNPHSRKLKGSWLLLVFMAIAAAVYWPGLSGGFFFDDNPNIVDNRGVQPSHADLATLVNAALSSPASEFKRPLASLSFALNYLASGKLDPYSMKLTNLVIHLLNGLLVFLLARVLIQLAAPRCVGATSPSSRLPDDEGNRAGRAQNFTTGSVSSTDSNRRAGIVASLLAAAWMLLPINLTGVLYVVQREESMANLFALLGLIGYVVGRRRMLGLTDTPGFAPSTACPDQPRWGTFWLCAISITVPATVGILAKETAVMLPLYALLVEWALFRFRTLAAPRDHRLIALFLIVLALPMIAGLAWLVPSVLNHAAWATRDFTLGTRLLSEARIVVGYIAWTLVPVPQDLSFYHDNFHISTGLFSPWTTFASILVLAGLVALALWVRSRRPLVALGIALFLGCHLLTGTIIPLELIYEHRNYFASFGLLLAIIPLLAAPVGRASAATTTAEPSQEDIAHGTAPDTDGLPMALPRYVLLAGLMLCWTGLTALTAYAWGNPLLLAQTLAIRAPQSPRAEYELGRTYIIYSHYDPASPFTKLAYAPLEKAAPLPDASILPEQALIFMSARMHLPLKEAWWNSMITKLTARRPGVQDESSLGALTQCDRDHQCDLPKQRMTQAYLAALSHPDPSARLLAMYGDYAWNVLEDHALGERMTEDAVKAAPREPAYRITLVRMLVVQGRKDDARAALDGLQALDIGGRLDTSLEQLRALPDMQ